MLKRSGEYFKVTKLCIDKFGMHNEESHIPSGIYTQYISDLLCKGYTIWPASCETCPMILYSFAPDLHTYLMFEYVGEWEED